MSAAGDAIRILGIELIGVSPENARKLLVTAAFILVVLLVGWLLRAILGWIGNLVSSPSFRFWSRQISSMLLAILLLLGIVSIWFDDPDRLLTAAGLITAGLAFALQRVITATAGYFVILRGKTFNVGDRIAMGGVRGDVIALSFMQTKIMEMGQPPAVQADDPAMWVYSRQFTGRIVTVTNDKIFDEPVYNYTHRFPFVWDEIRLPIRYGDDRERAEAILLEAALQLAVTGERLTDDQRDELERRYNLPIGDVAPRVYWRLTDNWLELTVRFLTPDHGSRELKDRMSRQILAALDEANIPIASATFEISAAPPLRVETARSD